MENTDLKDPFAISLRILGTTMKLTIEREDEELYRTAEKLITNRFNFYATKYDKVNDRNTWVYMTLLDVALRVQMLKQEQAPIAAKIAELNTKLSEALSTNSSID